MSYIIEIMNLNMFSVCIASYPGLPGLGTRLVCALKENYVLFVLVTLVERLCSIFFIEESKVRQKKY